MGRREYAITCTAPDSRAQENCLQKCSVSVDIEYLECGWCDLETKNLLFIILINLNLSSNVWLVATILDRTDLDYNYTDLWPF